MIKLIPLTDAFTIYQITDNQSIPDPIPEADFYSVTRTIEEISIITNCKSEIDGLKSEKGWKGFKVEGALDFSLVGIIHEITKPLKDSNIPVFVVSTFNTDYFFVKEEFFNKALDAFNRTENIQCKLDN